MPESLELILPDWPAPRHVRACFSTRVGGVSQGRYAALNLATHVGDDPQSVQQNRARLQAHLPAGPCWLEQVHGATVVDATHAANGARADGAISRQAGVVCAVMTADCLPVLFCTADGRAVGAAHAGWRGLAAGVLENTLTALQAAPTGVMAWLGPAISQTAFEVGTEVREAFVGRLPAAAEAFVATGPGKWHADLYLLARQRLRAAGVSQIFGGGLCTYSDSRRFFSARRDGTQSGRMAGLVWIDA